MKPQRKEKVLGVARKLSLTRTTTTTQQQQQQQRRQRERPPSTGSSSEAHAELEVEKETGNEKVVCCLEPEDFRPEKGHQVRILQPCVPLLFRWTPVGLPLYSPFFSLL